MSGRLRISVATDDIEGAKLDIQNKYTTKQRKRTISTINLPSQSLAMIVQIELVEVVIR